MSETSYGRIDIDKILQVLPHRYPMLLVDRVLELHAHSDITAYKNVTINEQVFTGHFPREPIYPGVMIIEGMAQAGGILAFVSTWGLDFTDMQDKVVYFMTIDNVKFRVPVKPGDRLTYKMKVLKQRSSVWQLEGKAYIDDVLASEAELKAMVTESKNK
ncbi:3-hydroxyacyl-ACP dehydratase FabZ [Helicobacter saguini]|uniref:3-hydroxyacyl-[acyl-carrier-protein] dehydratase FabZ n=1 Tax=Helicobacter saguini TaxID=1548018 RepID=A0A347VQG8_9HELI|nr:3-hydroxyacyl-ACP dehydratase FabZ [Helicobacter saguini]MWV60948.1 3-hydroxyacyl-ACP dehydratase FabZ [Helicobacter saguini]MWV68384.1 3-hydroxyacyl-ACP dehydratase FabZ [Helicobacter saguini]MWV70152.1 3-hydroxyacyl-ACP dehydratase FabZ [Helicobacter saguini]MWV72055.1 3-hydroxyacyl-ACP dehydratase FabZ [Helicobacter saguini]TLD93721.1 3-hydroxyacyl-ACP dehydratase FabZ [Helicobacter saguini]